MNLNTIVNDTTIQFCIVVMSIILVGALYEKWKHRKPKISKHYIQQFDQMLHVRAEQNKSRLRESLETSSEPVNIVSEIPGLTPREFNLPQYRRRIVKTREFSVNLPPFIETDRNFPSIETGKQEND